MQNFTPAIGVLSGLLIFASMSMYPIKTVLENDFMNRFLTYNAFFDGFVILIVGSISDSSVMGVSCVSSGSSGFSLS